MSIDTALVCVLILVAEKNQVVAVFTCAPGLL